MAKQLLVTGSSGLIGSEVVTHFAQAGWTVHGVDNNMRADFFGPGGDTRWNTRRLKEQFPSFQHHELDIRETFRIDQTKHSLLGASKVAADVMVQEYGRYFGMPTCALRGGQILPRIP